jgi:hypothetical protein
MVCQPSADVGPGDDSSQATGSTGIRMPLIYIQWSRFYTCPRIDGVISINDQDCSLRSVPDPQNQVSTAEIGRTLLEVRMSNSAVSGATSDSYIGAPDPDMHVLRPAQEIMEQENRA